MKKLLLLIVLLISMPAMANPLEEALRQLEQLGQAEYAAAEEAMPEIVALNERDVTSFIAVAGELEALALRQPGEDFDLLDGAAGLRASRDALRIIEGRGFSVEHLQNVGYSIALALAALQMEEEPGELARMRAEQEAALAEMRASLPPELVSMFEQQMLMAEGVMGQLHDQPPQNRALVERYRADLEMLFEED